MQLSQSWSDRRAAARTFREENRKRTPYGYPTNRGPAIEVLNLNKPGVFAAMQANTTGVPSSQLSPPAPPPRPVNQSPPVYYGYTPNPYKNVNSMYWGSFQGNELGDWLTDLSQAVQVGAQAYAKVSAADALTQFGVQPVGYSAYGTPLYQSTPAGVTPQYGGMVPSGMVLPPGVSPSMPYPVGFVQQAGANGAYQIQPPSFMQNAGNLLPVLAAAGGLVLFFALMK